MTIDLRPLGDRAFLARFADEDAASRWAGAVRARAWPGVVDVALAYASAAVFVDPDVVDPDTLEGRLRAIEPGPGGWPAGRLISVPVRYDGEDLAEVSRLVGLAEAEVVARHSGRDYRVFAIGFQPGFPYAGYLDASLSGLPRRSTPRVRVPAGSVAIAGRQTGIYPAESPGGWLLLGRTPLRIFDLGRGYFPIRAGDRLRFEAIDDAAFDAMRGSLLTSDTPSGLADPAGPPYT